MLRVVLLRDGRLDHLELERDQRQALALDPGDDLADQLPLDAVGLDQDEGSFDSGGPEDTGGSSLCSGGR